MIKRLNTICSYEEILNKDMQELKLSFIRSHYPIKLLNKLFCFKPRDHEQTLSIEQNLIYFGLKFYNNKSEKFGKRISNTIQKTIGRVRIIPYFPCGRKLLSYFSSKIKPFNRDTSTGVYRIRCIDCNLEYIGETGRAMKIRLREHESNCRNHSNPSALVNHSELGHTFDFSNARVIYPETHITRRKIAKALLIHNTHVIDGNMNSFPLTVFRK
jgi:hypothetical protein